MYIDLTEVREVFLPRVGGQVVSAVVSCTMVMNPGSERPRNLDLLVQLSVDKRTGQTHLGPLHEWNGSFVKVSSSENGFTASDLTSDQQAAFDAACAYILENVGQAVRVRLTADGFLEGEEVYHESSQFAKPSSSRAAPV